MSYEDLTEDEKVIVAIIESIKEKLNDKELCYVQSLTNFFLDYKRRNDKAIERLQDYDIVEDKEKVIEDTFDILRGDKE